MAREVLLLAMSGLGGNAWVGEVCLFFLVVASLSMISMIIFACGSDGNSRNHRRSRLGGGRGGGNGGDSGGGCGGGGGGGG